MTWSRLTSCFQRIMEHTGGGLLYSDFGVHPLSCSYICQLQRWTFSHPQLLGVSGSVQQLHRQQHIGLVGLHDAAVHQHLVQYEVRLHDTIDFKQWKTQWQSVPGLATKPCTHVRSSCDMQETAFAPSRG